MNKLYIEKVNLITRFKNYLKGLGFIEAVTPVFYNFCGSVFKRMSTESGFSLRHCMEWQLRCLTETFANVFELGPCFRMDLKDSMHGQEFLLCEIIKKNGTIYDFMTIIKGFVLSYNQQAKFEIVSIREFIKDDIQVDIINDDLTILISKIKAQFPTFKYNYEFQLINHYISEKIEKRVRDTYTFLIDYPSITLSIAKLKEKNLVHRFELFWRGIEIANSYEYEDDMTVFEQRNRDAEMYSEEENYLKNKILKHEIPSQAAIMGVGIERLCMTLFDSMNINDYLKINNLF